MTRFVIVARTLLHVLESGRTVGPAHQLAAPASIRSQVMDLLLQKVQHGDLTDQGALALHEQAAAPQRPGEPSHGMGHREGAGVGQDRSRRVHRAGQAPGRRPDHD